MEGFGQGLGFSNIGTKGDWGRGQKMANSIALRAEG